MTKAHFILIFTLLAFRLFAQPALPTTNQTFAPIANPYSGSWIYYTTNSVSGLGYLNGASIPYVMTVSNSVVTYVNASTNGFVGASITNGLASTAYVNGATNGLVTSAITNGFATTNYVRTATNGFVGSSITNGLATTAYVNAATNGFVGSSITNGLASISYVSATTNGFVTAAITNGLATTNYVRTATNGFVGSTITNGLATTNYVLALGVNETNFANQIGLNATNFGLNIGLNATNYANAIGANATNLVNSATNGLVSAAVTNGLATINYVNVKPTVIWSGTSGNTTVTKGSTVYAPPNSDAAMLASDASGSSRAPVTRNITLTNLFVIVSGSTGSSGNTLTIMTNGAASSLAVSINSGITATNDTADSVTIPAGTEIGVRIVTAGGSTTAVKWEWSFEGY